MSQRLEPRTIKEAHAYVELTPCSYCGRVDRAEKGSLSFEGDRTVKHHAWACSGCGTQREFTFVYPPGDDYLQVEGYGPAGVASTLMDAGQFLFLSDQWSKSVPASPAGDSERRQAAAAMSEAIACLEEVLKFIGPGPDDEPPPHALQSAKSKRMLSELPGQFRRARLEARLKAYRGMLAGFTGGSAGGDDGYPVRTEAIDMRAVLEAHGMQHSASKAAGAAAGAASANALVPRQKSTEWDTWLDEQLRGQLRDGEHELLRVAGCSPWVIFLRSLAKHYYIVLTNQRVLIFHTKRLKKLFSFGFKLQKVVKKVETVELAEVEKVVTVKSGWIVVLGMRGVGFHYPNNAYRQVVARRSSMFADNKGDYVSLPQMAAEALAKLRPA